MCHILIEKLYIKMFRYVVNAPGIKWETLVLNVQIVYECATHQEENYSIKMFKFSIYNSFEQTIRYKQVLDLKVMFT